MFVAGPNAQRRWARRYIQQGGNDQLYIGEYKIWSVAHIGEDEMCAFPSMLLLLFLFFLWYIQIYYRYVCVVLLVVWGPAEGIWKIRTIGAQHLYRDWNWGISDEFGSKCSVSTVWPYFAYLSIFAACLVLHAVNNRVHQKARRYGPCITVFHFMYHHVWYWANKHYPCIITVYHVSLYHHAGNKVCRLYLSISPCITRWLR